MANQEFNQQNKQPMQQKSDTQRSQPGVSGSQPVKNRDANISGNSNRLNESR